MAPPRVTWPDLLAKIEPNAETDCWEWQGYLDKDGYAVSAGSYTAYGTNRAHRAVWIAIFGPIPEGFELHHVCKNRRCVNPQHMKPVTSKENKIGVRHKDRDKTHCKWGHEFTPKNTLIIYRPSGVVERFCRACNNRRQKETQARKRQL